MPWWAWLATMLPVGAWLWRLAFRATINSLRDGQPEDASDVGMDAFDVGMAIAIATLAFPFIGLGALLVGSVKRAVANPAGEVYWPDVARALGGETREQKHQRRESELRARERRVAALERELGIGPYAPDP